METKQLIIEPDPCSGDYFFTINTPTMKLLNNTALRLVALISVFSVLVIACTDKKQLPAEKPVTGKQLIAEKLTGIVFNYDKNEIELSIVSNGCSGKADFRWIVSGNEVLVERIKKDECKAMPEAVKLIFTFREAGIDADKAYTVVNPFIANPNLAGIR
jgi:hypothetical protein